jgi:hypothetical protein
VSGRDWVPWVPCFHETECRRVVEDRASPIWGQFFFSDGRGRSKLGQGVDQLVRVDDEGDDPLKPQGTA